MKFNLHMWVKRTDGPGQSKRPGTVEGARSLLCVAVVPVASLKRPGIGPAGLCVCLAARTPNLLNTTRLAYSAWLVMMANEQPSWI